MDQLVCAAEYSFRTCFALYEEKFFSHVSKYPLTEKEQEEEKKCIQILQCVLNEVNRYYRFVFDEDAYIISFRLSAYLSQVSTLHLPLSSKIHNLLIKINEKINNRR